MRLLDVESLIYRGAARLIECDASHVPPYAILSHTWSSEEVLFQDVALGPDYDLHETPYQPEPTWREQLAGLCSPTPSAICKECKLKQCGHLIIPASNLRRRPKAGWNKVLNACLRACKDGYRFIWIDTCCINKFSSAELSEAINSMFEWYARSNVCYVYLEDCVDCPLRIRLDESVCEDNWRSWFFKPAALREKEKSGMNPCMIAQLRSCKWLTRGWTLQELIAPERMTFVDRDWVLLFDRSEVPHVLHDITGIARGLFHRNELCYFDHPKRHPVENLQKHLRQLSVVEKMSWVGLRRTTRSEDIAYCLLGIFGVNLPLLYGEGQRAFARLQDAIMRVNVDQTILAWEYDVPMWSDTKIYKDMLFAPDPNHFHWWSSFKRNAIKTALSINEPSITGSMEFPESFELTNAGLQISLRCLDASTVQRTAVRLSKWSQTYGSPSFRAGSEESTEHTLGQALKSDEHDENGDDEIDENWSSANVGSDENSVTDYNGTSASVNDSDGIIDSDQDEARRSHKYGDSCAFLDCELELGGATYAIAIQLQHTQAGDRYRASTAVDENLSKHRDYPHRLLFVKAEAVKGAMRRAMLIRHDYAAWF